MAGKKPEAKTTAKPKVAKPIPVKVQPEPHIDVTSKDFLGTIIDLAHARARIISAEVNPTNIFVLRYMALAEQAQELINLMNERGHTGIPTEAE